MTHPFKGEAFMVTARYGRTGAVAAIIVLLTAVCTATDDAASSDESVELPQIAADPRGDGPSALDDTTHADFPEPLIDPDEVMSGGPPPDGIPPLDEPRFEKTGAVDWLADAEPVLSLTVGAETRAYPIQIMTWHEIVNDTVDDVPVAVTYCPLCNSGVAFDRRDGESVLSFGTSGMLYESNLVMYDRQTESLWPQLTGQASIGTATGTTLDAIPMGAVAWSDFKAAHPDAWVLSRDTGFDRDYGTNPYTGYDNPDGTPLFGSGDDDRLAPMERVVGIGEADTAVAIVRSTMAAADSYPITVDGHDLVVWHHGGQSSALDSQDVAEGADIGSVGVFLPEADGRQLDFTATAEGFIDTQTGSQWNILG